MSFSGALTITDLDDFLNPSQACIIPVRQTNKVAGQEKGINGSTEIHIDSNNNYYEVSTYPTAGPSNPNGAEKKALEKAEINLNDCLACSGCITSTESLLITLQSQNEVLDFISKLSSSPSEESRTPVLSISPQSLASLSAAYSARYGQSPLSLLTLLHRIRSFLAQPKRGGWQTWDTTFSRHLSLRDTRAEYLERSAKGKEKDSEAAGLPILASACPGWVCYAEKAQGDLLPYMSAVRSSQAIMGGLVKAWWGSRVGLKPNEIYHVTAMPCYDKKLEASRSDFYSAMYSTRDVDCVLTTGELDLLLVALGFDPYTASQTGPTDPASPNGSVNGNSTNGDHSTMVDRLSSPWPELLNHPGSSSGSYLSSIITSIAVSHPNPTRVTTREIRGSPDNVEYFLEDTVTHEVIFKGSKCYGFRNLQNLVRKVGKETGVAKGVAARGAGAGRLSAAVAARRRKAKLGVANGNGDSAGTSTGMSTPLDADTDSGSRSGAGNGVNLDAALKLEKNRDEKKLDFVEVMACPSGCVNGGGQMKPVFGATKVRNSGIATVELDEEGYERPLADEGVEVPSKIAGTVEGVQGVDEGMRWSTKEWVGKVEEIYWSGLPTSSIGTDSVSVGYNGVEMVNGNSNGDGHDHQQKNGNANANGNGNVNGFGNGHPGPSTTTAWTQARLEEADRLAEQVMRDICGFDESNRISTAAPVAQQGTPRWEFLRTRYRKVEGDVLGGSEAGGVTHEAVKW